MKRMKILIFLIFIVTLGCVAQEPFSEGHVRGLLKVDTTQHMVLSVLPVDPESGYLINKNGYPLWFNGVAWDTLSGGGGGPGTLYTFENGITESGGTVTAGGVVEDDISFTNDGTDNFYIGDVGGDKFSDVGFYADNAVTASGTNGIYLFQSSRMFIMDATNGFRMVGVGSSTQTNVLYHNPVTNVITTGAAPSGGAAADTAHLDFRIDTTSTAMAAMVSDIAESAADIDTIKLMLADTSYLGVDLRLKIDSASEYYEFVWGNSLASDTLQLDTGGKYMKNISFRSDTTVVAQPRLWADSANVGVVPEFSFNIAHTQDLSQSPTYIWDTPVSISGSLCTTTGDTTKAVDNDTIPPGSLMWLEFTTLNLGKKPTGLFLEFPVYMIAGTTSVAPEEPPVEPPAGDTSFYAQFLFESDMIDEQGNVSAALKGSAGYTSTLPIEGAYSLNLSNSYSDGVILTNVNHGTTSDGFTICFWVSPGAKIAAATNVLYATNNATTSDGFSLWWNTWAQSDGKLRFYCSDGTTRYDYASPANDVLTAGTTSHVAMVYDGAGGWKFYIDGSEETMTLTGTGHDNFTKTGQNPVIGNWTSTSNSVGGKIDDFRIYHEAKDATEIGEIYGGL